MSDQSVLVAEEEVVVAGANLVVEAEEVVMAEVEVEAEEAVVGEEEDPLAAPPQERLARWHRPVHRKRADACVIVTIRLPGIDRPSIQCRGRRG